YAHPRDLLTFACTLLVDKSSVLIWKTARSKIEGLPDCPADLTEYDYADLALRPRCHGCFFWEMRHRYCSDCRVERVCCLPVCPEIIQKRYVLGMEHLTIGKGMGHGY
ncbi:hypothetical protein L210DRAFT_3572612, partial [Boletus edulis BED1]